MSAIKAHAVQPENTMVARVTLANMKQDREEPVRSFRGQAGVCKYIIKCPSCATEVNYMECIVRDVVCCGIADPDIQLDVLGDKNQDMALEEMLRFIEAKESGKRSASRLLDSQGVEEGVSCIWPEMWRLRST